MEHKNLLIFNPLDEKKKRDKNPNAPYRCYICLNTFMDNVAAQFHTDVCESIQIKKKEASQLEVL